MKGRSQADGNADGEDEVEAEFEEETGIVAGDSGDEEVFDELAADTSKPVEVNTDAIRDALAPPDQLTGRADATNDDLTVLFRDEDGQHFEDGFAGSGDEDTDHVSQNDGDSEPDATGHERKGI